MYRMTEADIRLRLGDTPLIPLGAVDGYIQNEEVPYDGHCYHRCYCWSPLAVLSGRLKPYGSKSPSYFSGIHFRASWVFVSGDDENSGYTLWVFRHGRVPRLILSTQLQ